ncbi:malonate transporter subunit MadL [Maribacter algarum]|uniref:Malonate transporter subunit MadL n=1 Tax=Maribacter algarum (ex Zhang et al. 2020) TaxID=2578118 RepID=A0A5S3PRU7_9FLAO|nr:malonate transporter subunit MadL [Maribacter algarum]TMM56633.1 malonate transporter subunit MadL [Maribacter algarum]
MKIYGVALLAFCFLTGKFIGNLLGAAIGISGDVGGVGFGMLLLILGNMYLKRKGLLEPPTEKGILFWSSMYIPVVVAMSATQNVKAAISEGPIAIIVGVIVTITGFFLVPLISKIGRKKQND